MFKRLPLRILARRPLRLLLLPSFRQEARFLSSVRTMANKHARGSSTASDGNNLHQHPRLLKQPELSQYVLEIPPSLLTRFARGVNESNKQLCWRYREQKNKPRYLLSEIILCSSHNCLAVACVDTIQRRGNVEVQFKSIS